MRQDVTWADFKLFLKPRATLSEQLSDIRSRIINVLSWRTLLGCEGRLESAATSTTDFYGKLLFCEKMALNPCHTRNIIALISIYIKTFFLQFFCFFVSKKTKWPGSLPWFQTVIISLSLASLSHFHSLFNVSSKDVGEDINRVHEEEPNIYRSRLKFIFEMKK